MVDQKHRKGLREQHALPAVFASPWFGVGLTTLLLALALGTALAFQTSPLSVVLSCLTAVAGGLAPRWPRASLVALVPLAFVVAATSEETYGIGALSVAIALASLAALGHRRLGWVGAGFFALSAIVETSRFGWPMPTKIEELALRLLSIGGALGVGAALRRSRDAELVIAADDRRRELQHRIELSRQLHDTVAYAVTTMVMRADGARARGAEPSTDADLRAIAATGRGAMHDLRRLMAWLRSAEGPETVLLPSARLTEVVHAQVTKLREAGFTVRVATEGDLDHLGDAEERTMGAVLSELASNVVKHGVPGSDVVLMLERGSQQVEVMCTNRVTADPDGNPEEPMGLVGLAERLSAVAGQLTVSQNSGVWMASVTLPVRVDDVRG